MSVRISKNGSILFSTYHMKIDISIGMNLLQIYVCEDKRLLGVQIKLYADAKENSPLALGCHTNLSSSFERKSLWVRTVDSYSVERAIERSPSCQLCALE
ncbi:hypothetical protein ACH5RR_012911 [Cinchona calisaya]|uniref:Uncharacterized protein n=1 Tax=Cinchona calisaya TaxID=153742 RepID=A0ABD3ACR9_9GENT